MVDGDQLGQDVVAVAVALTRAMAVADRTSTKANAEELAELRRRRSCRHAGVAMAAVGATMAVAI